MFEVRHQVPGRLRLHLPALRTDSALARALPTQLRTYQGVQAVRANPACASLTITHDPRRVSAAQLQQGLIGLLHDAPPAATVHRAEAKQPGPKQPGSKRLGQGGWLRLGFWFRGCSAGQGGRATAVARNLACSQPSISSPSVAMLCRLNLRFSRWMLRETLKCWWHGELDDPARRRLGA